MGSLRHEEVRRLLKYLRGCIEDPDHLAEIEEELHGEFAEEFLREPDLLTYFPELAEEFVAADMHWKLRVIPHAHLRMIQRGLKQAEVSTSLRRFVEAYMASGQVITTGPYNIVGRPKPRAAIVTVRADVESVTDETGLAHTVTVFIGRGDIEDRTEVNLD